MLFTSRSGITQPFNAAVLSGNNIWKRNTIPRWSTDNNATDYGIWTQSVTINSYTNPGQNGNYATLYQSNFQGLANPNPPTANPQTGAFRIYLPSDSGAAPVMPYLDQQVATGGPALAVGGTKKFTITLRIVNPTAQAITFSATNLITANVPGSGVVYAGNALVGQGSIVSQPSVGGTGNITWNPGTLAAGVTAIMRGCGDAEGAEIRGVANGDGNDGVEPVHLPHLVTPKRSSEPAECQSSHRIPFHTCELFPDAELHVE